MKKISKPQSATLLALSALTIGAFSGTMAYAQDDSNAIEPSSHTATQTPESVKPVIEKFADKGTVEDTVSKPLQSATLSKMAFYPTATTYFLAPDELQQLRSQLTSTEDKLDIAQKQLDTTSGNLKVTQDKLDKANADSQDKQTTIDKLTGERDASNKSLDETKTQLDKTTKERDDNKVALDKANAEKEKLQQEVDKLKAQVESLQEQIDNATPTVNTNGNNATDSTAVESKNDVPATLSASVDTISDTQRQAIVKSALSQLGNTQDCTMLATNSLKAIGVNHHGWPESYLGLGKEVERSKAQPGDLVIWMDNGTHVMMANGKVQQHIAVVVENNNGELTLVHGGWASANGDPTQGTTALWSDNIPGASTPIFISVAS